MLILSIIYVSIICLIYRYELILFELFCVGKKKMIGVIFGII